MQLVYNCLINVVTHKFSNMNAWEEGKCPLCSLLDQSLTHMHAHKHMHITHAHNYVHA